MPVPPGDDEVARLARTMNDMLERVDDAAQRQRRFVADASHELRSPLTRMRTELEVDLAHPDRADLLATHASVLDETIGLQRLADDLLLVARADEGNVGEIRREPVDLDDIVLRVARRLAPTTGCSVDLTGVGAGRVVGDRDLLARLVGNLADNAVRHATSTVDLSLAERDGQVVLAVHDDGPGVPTAERDRIFERFARARRRPLGGQSAGPASASPSPATSPSSTAAPSSSTPTATGARFVLTLPAVSRALTVRAARGELLADVGEGLHPLLGLVGALEHPLALDHERRHGGDAVAVGLGALGVHEVGLGVGREQRGRGVAVEADVGGERRRARRGRRRRARR